MDLRLRGACRLGRNRQVRTIAVSLALATVLASWHAPADAAYSLRYSLTESGKCDFRVGWHVSIIGQRLFAGGPWDPDDCGVYGYGLLVYDLETGGFDRELLGTLGAAMVGANIALGHVDGVQIVDPTSLTVVRTLVGPNAEHPWIVLQGAVAGDLLAVGEGDTPETTGRLVVFRLATASGAVLQRYVVPPQPGLQILDAAAGSDAVAVGAFTVNAAGVYGSAAGVFVFGADDGELRWSKATPPSGYSPRVGRAVAVTGEHVIVGAPSRYPDRPRGQALVFALGSGTLMQTLEAPGTSTAFDLFGRAVAASQGIVVVGAPGLGQGERPGRAFVFDESDGTLLDTLSAPSEIAVGDAVAIGDDVIAVGGNEYDGVVHVFERFVTMTTTTTTLSVCNGGCDDGDVCTVDTCVAGQCTSTLPLRLDLKRCRLQQLRDAVDCAPRRIARRLDARLGRLAERLSRAERRFSKHFRAYCRAVERSRSRGRLPADCAAVLSIECPGDSPE